MSQLSEPNVRKRTLSHPLSLLTCTPNHLFHAQKVVELVNVVGKREVSLSMLACMGKPSAVRRSCSVAETERKLSRINLIYRHKGILLGGRHYSIWFLPN